MKSMSRRTQAVSFSEATFLNSFSVILLFIPLSTFTVDRLALLKVQVTKQHTTTTTTSNRNNNNNNNYDTLFPISAVIKHFYLIKKFILSRRK